MRKHFNRGATMTISFRPGIRENVGLIIGMFGASGSGKTYSAMRLASCLSGGKPFAVIDTESRRALHYADMFKFDHGELHAHSVQRHILRLLRLPIMLVIR